MSFFGTPPVKPRTILRRARSTSIGVDGDCDLLGTDPQGLEGRPHDTTQTMSSIKKFMPFSPNCVRWLAIPIYKAGPDGVLYQFQALDALGQWWTGSFSWNAGKLYKSSEPGSDDRGWFEKAVGDVVDAVVTYGVPILAAALATTGVGVIGAAALLAWRSLAMGSSLSSALISATQTKLAPSPSALDAFNQGMAKAEAGLTDAAFREALKALPSASTSEGPQQAFSHAVQIVRAKQVQDLTLGALATVLTGDEMNRINLALKWGAPLADIMTAVRGKAGDQLLSGTTLKAGQFVTDNIAAPSKITAALSAPSTLKSFVATAPPLKLQQNPGGASGSGGASSGSGIGTVVVVGALGYGAFKLWPAIRARLAGKK